MTSPEPPQARVVAMASATIRAAPRAEFVPPRRNRVATISGGDVGVQTVAISAFRPLTPL